MAALMIIGWCLVYLTIGTVVTTIGSYVVARFDTGEGPPDQAGPYIATAFWPVVLVVVELLGTIWLAGRPVALIQPRAVDAARRARQRHVACALDEEQLATLSIEERRIVESVVRRTR